MAAFGTSNASPATELATALQLQAGSVTFTAPVGEVEAIPQECLQRSQVLRDLLDSTDVTAEAEVPVTPAALQLWVRHGEQPATTSSDPDQGVPPHHGDASAEIQCARPASHGGSSDDCSGPATDVQEACLLLTVADVLVDDTTRDFAARAIAAVMTQPSRKGDSAVPEAVAALPEHLQLSILSCAPLPHCLTHLPPSWHPLTLRAHHPSIAAHTTLALPRLPIATVHAALSATATLTPLRALSLAGLTLPLDVAPCISLLENLTALTALGLHDIGLQQPTAAAFATVLPVLRDLESLDLSSNHVTDVTMQALAPALRRCMGLRALDLSSTLSMAGTHGTGASELADAMKPLQLLTAVAIGVYTCRPVTAESGPPRSMDRTALLEALLLLPQFASLSLDLFSRTRSYDGGEKLLSGLGQMTQLRSLRCTLHPVLPHHAIPFSTAAQLTSLGLDYIMGLEAMSWNRAPSLASQLSSLGKLTRLQRLWLRVPIAGELNHMKEACGVLREVFPGLVYLSHFELRAAPVDYAHELRGHMDWGAVAEVVEAALAMPRLRALHVPIFATDSWLEQPVDMPALARGRTLSIDLFMRFKDPASHAAVGTLVRLLPFVETLDVMCGCSGHMGMLNPLITETAALVNLKALRFEAWHDSDDIDRPVVAFLEGLACLTQLLSLEVAVHSGNGGRPRRGMVRSRELAGFLRGVQSLTRLTRLSYAMCARDDVLHEDLLEACAWLQELEVLELVGFESWNSTVCWEVLPRLPALRVLHVPMQCTGGGTERYEWEARGRKALHVVGRLEQLRCIEVSDSCDFHPTSGVRFAVDRLTAELPAFQTYGISDRLYSFTG